MDVTYYSEKEQGDGCIATPDHLKFGGPPRGGCIHYGRWMVLFGLNFVTIFVAIAIFFFEKR
jgi:hypothetical protein